MDAILDRLDHTVMDGDVFGGFGFHDCDARAEHSRVADPRAGFDPESLGFVRGRDAARGLRHHWGDTHRAAAQGRVQVLFDRCEKRVAIDKKRCERMVQGRELCVAKFGGQF